MKFNQGAWVVVVMTPFLVYAFLRLRKQYTREKEALNITVQSSRATSITRHDVTVLIDNFDLATIGAIRYARSLNPRNLSAVHFVIDDRKAESLSKEWAKNEACSDVPLELIDCPDRRLPNAAVDYAIRTKKHINILFLDEVFSSVDLENIQKILGLLKSFSNQYNVNIFVVHHAVLNQEMFDRIIRVNKEVFSTIEELHIEEQ